MPEYYIVEFILKCRNYFTIWYTDDRDGFVTSGDKIYRSGTLEELKKYAEDNEIPLHDDEIARFDIDRLLSSNISEMSCDEIMNYWNIFSDMAGSAGVRFCGDDKSYNVLYNEIFSGCGAAVTVFGSKTEGLRKDYLEETKFVLEQGCEILHNALERPFRE
ncbi:MAG: hypothetical protein K2N72_05080 [Oscillospiraceae bacterium]|nr:hypothetical protein [Oscillospiraceae bacterium]